MVVVIVLVLVTVGTVLFHFLAPTIGWWWTPIASNWGFIDTTVIITFWVTGVIFVAVVFFMAYCIFRFRYQKGKRAAYRPENNKLELWLTGLTALGVVVMLTPGLFVWNQFVNVPEDADEVEVMAQQWQWSYRFPGEDGVLGTTSPRFIDDDNPFGINPNDANGQDDILIDDSELHLPLDRPVKVLLRSIDVLHDFYVPQFRAKMDMVPGMITYYWLTPIRAGTFDALCFELCGVGHHAMRGTVVVETESEFKAWLEEYSTFAQSMARVENGAGKVLNLAAREVDAAAVAKKSAP